MKKRLPNIKKFILQKDTADCGVACIQNILSFYKINLPAENIRSMSGTANHGTTLLGLSQAASQLGFIAQGVEINNAEDLKTIEHPCILYTIKDNRQHYIVLYGWTGKNFLTGDPARGIMHLTENELNALWPRRIALLMSPGDMSKLEQTRNHSKLNLQWIKAIASKYVNLMVIVCFLGLLVAVLNLSTAIFSQKLVDKLLNEATHAKIYLSILLLGILLFFKGGINYFRGLILAHQSKLFNSELTVGFYEKVLQLPKSFFDNRKTGDIVSRLNDTTRIQQCINMLSGEIAIQLLLLISALVIIFIYSITAGLFSLLFVPTIFLIVKKFQPQISNGQKETMIAYAANESNYIDNIKGIGIIKLLNRQNYFLNKTKEIYHEYQMRLFNISKIKIHFSLIVEIAAAIFLGILITTGVTLVLHKQLMAGEMIAILQLSIIVMQSSTTVSITNIQIQEAKIAFDRISEITSINPDNLDVSHLNVDSNTFLLNELSIQNLQFGFPGQKPLLKKLCLNIRKGEITAIVGESGQGKSTLFQLLQKFYKCNSGEILVNGKNLEAYNTQEWRTALGVVTQEPILFSGTVIENIALNNSDANLAKEVIEFCQKMGFDYYINKLPQGYNTLVGEGGVNISGGQKQLISLARCLYHQPQLLLLDEPTAAMDKNTEHFVLNILNKLKRKSAIIVISHKDSLTNIADNIYNMEEGSLHPVKTVPGEIETEQIL